MILYFVNLLFLTTLSVAHFRVSNDRIVNEHGFENAVEGLIQGIIRWDRHTTKRSSDSLSPSRDLNPESF